MKKFKLVTTATLVAQITAGDTVDIIVDESGTLYLPVASSNGFGGGKPSSSKEVAAPETAEAIESAAAPKQRGRGGAKDVAQAAAKVVSAIERSAVLTIFQEVEANGDENSDAAIDALGLSADVSAKVKELVSDFMADADLTADGQTDAAMKLIDGGGSEAPAKSKRGGGKAAPVEKLVEAKDLKKGDKVAVWLNGDAVQDEKDVRWWNAEVTKVGRGGLIEFTFEEDGESAEYDADLMDKIKYQ